MDDYIINKIYKFYFSDHVLTKLLKKTLIIKIFSYHNPRYIRNCVYEYRNDEGQWRLTLSFRKFEQYKYNLIRGISTNYKL